MLSNISWVVHRHLALSLILLNNVILSTGFIFGFVFIICYICLVNGDPNRPVCLLHSLIGVLV